MERQLFDYDGYDMVSDMVFVFYDCVLKININDFKIGDRVSIANLDFESGTLELCDSSGEVFSKHELVLSIK